MAIHRDQWKNIKRRSRSADDFERLGSLAAATACTEVALTALGIEKLDREGPVSRLRRSGLVGSKHFPALDEIDAAVKSRHFAAHEFRAAPPEECEKHIRTLSKTWCALRGAFVTKAKAAQLAKQLLTAERLTEVFLFGSLARGKKEPKDIDLLIYDDGDISFLRSEYGASSMSIARYTLEAGSMLSPANEAALECGWLDIIVINGDLFGTNQRYTHSVACLQHDPLFLINIADDLRWYDPDDGKWKRNRPEVFQRLALLRRSLEVEGLVAWGH